MESLESSSSYQGSYTLQVLKKRIHNQTPTCIATNRDGSIIVTGSKGGDISIFDFSTKKRIKHIKASSRKDANNFIGHSKQVLCLAISSDDKYLVSGGSDSLINIWILKSGKHLKCFKQHRGAIYDLVFQGETYQFSSCSADRTIKIWLADQLTCIDTLFGHQDVIYSSDSLREDQLVTVGGQDRTVRLWKISEEAQLVFKAPALCCNSLTTISSLNSNRFVTGTDTGNILLWRSDRKKPICIYHNAHENEIISLICIKNSETIISGSRDGFLRIWSVKEEKIKFVTEINIDGCINGIMAIDSKLFAAIGRDHRLGRWTKSDIVNCLIWIDFK